ncbi:hypothetical protein [Clostridium septicum]|uniref:Uncharacterized protein n=1 Tax=Clostridium septicum TaxID=1504 RepID=A0A9N7JJH7_CLOSE|nr:hypothetical protein [Clostridium septicum]AYE33445.1 hypothetical protein CP523_02680 [Clostridium septicum]MDU1314764.1 hypothetical protein [Clostridium septicum]QAS61616.1 hypothetical protein EI377_13205 [Clostridium septicum]UEC21945.1 hypothetical protein LK444_06180 [Clostridium septicum]USS00024.1 hypothetical protein NH397_11015 [Clostridium septicum]
MNFLLNKIDTDLRKKVYEKTVNGIVHRKTEISIYKDSEKQKGKSFNEFVKKDKKSKKKITVKANKFVQPLIQVKAEKKDDFKVSEYGSFLDIKK